MKAYYVIAEHKNYKCISTLETLFTSKEQAEKSIKEIQDKNYNYYIREIEVK